MAATPNSSSENNNAAHSSKGHNSEVHIPSAPQLLLRLLGRGLLEGTMHVPDHQVGGHKASAHVLGPLVDDSGRFFKPLQSGDRGSREAAFYKLFYSNSNIPPSILRFFPAYYGTQLVESSDSSGIRLHLVLEDLTANLHRPSIMDVKIGSRTWYPESSPEYTDKCLKKNRITTSLQLGFMISGFQMLKNTKGSEFWKPGKDILRSFSGSDVRNVLKKFVSVSSDPDSNPDCGLATAVYGGRFGILAQLLEIKAWFEDQTFFHFNSSSILMMYEKDEVLKGSGAVAQVKLVDFAHAFVEEGGVIDHNFLGGVSSFIKFISDILKDSRNDCL